ncbi:hypothetical protein PVAND_015924 [Polypedilum vanderplanki]|uniref:NACHT domain-containing protein n=1 Tax=Polypedilum vanderplanki TaxID=319348 RepID=A0A9J6BDZ7_POLVA|nr:hypothetical protein PVAND_015924 [Polypedilum vanderplanki]
MMDMKSFSFEYPLDNLKINFDTVEIPDDTNVIRVNNCPSTNDASKLISEPWFKKKVENLKLFKALIIKIACKFEIKAIETPKISDYDKNYFLVSLEPQDITNNYESIVYWKIKERKNILQLKNNKEYSADIFELARNFLIKTIIAENAALDKSSSPNDINIELTSLRDKNNQNILMFSIQNDTNPTIIHKLLKYPFDINQSLKDNNFTAADIAWEKKKFDILLLLLNANSMFPRFYDEDFASVEIKRFASICREMHDAARETDLIKAQVIIEDIIEKNPNLRYFYNSKNNSAAAVALKVQNFEVYKVLIDKSVHVGPFEDTEGIRSEFSEAIQKNLRAVHLQYSLDLPGRHIMIFMSNSYLGHDDAFSSTRYKSVKDAYKILDSIDICSVLLKLVAAKKNFKIIFDFNRDSVEFMDPTHDKNNKGVFYFSGKIYIGAKELLTSKFVTIGTIIHEVCHFTLVLVFQNDAKPYAVNDRAAKKEFQKIVKECKAHKDEDDIINWVFGYDEDQIEAELIVRVVHLTVHYHKDQERLKSLKQTFASLFRFYEQKVKPHVERAVPIIAKLTDSNDKLELTFGDLTEPMKQKIFSTEVCFQGHYIKLNKIINCDSNSSINSEKIFDLFNPDEVSDIFDDPDIEIGKIQEITENFYMNRKFLKPKLENKNEWEVKECNEIAKEVRDDKIFLLSDHAGAGKTTTFKHLALELKTYFPDFWISFVDLKVHLKIYENFEHLDENEWTREKILNFIKEILNLNDEKEKEEQKNLNLFVFHELFEKNKIILLFDGVDEISPHFKEFIKILIKSIHNLTKIQLWIATRPQYTEELEDFFAINARKLKPSDDAENFDFMKRILESLNVIDEEKQKLAIIKIQEFIIKLKNGNEDHAVNNPLMLEIITTICADTETAEANFYSIYRDMLRKKFENVHNRGDIVKKDALNSQWMDKTKFSIWQVFQVYSLQLIFGESFKDVMSDFLEPVKLHQLSIFKKWTIEKKNWKPEQISRYGVLIVDNFNQSDERVNFIHRTFAEFFVAQYLIDNIYEEMDESVNENERKLRLKLLITIGATKNTATSRFDVIRRFLTCYPTSKRQEGDTTGTKFDNKIKEFLIKNYRASFLFFNKENDNYDVVTATFFLSNFFEKDKHVIEALWLGNDNRSLFGKIFTNPQNSLYDIMEYIEKVEKIFGFKWPELTKFIPKKDNKYFFEGRDVKLKGDPVLERFFGLLDLVENRLTGSQCKEFYTRYFYDMTESFYMNNEAITEIFKRTKEIFRDKKSLANLVRDFIKNSKPKSCIFDENFVECFWNNFLKDFVNSDEKIIKSVLRFEYVPTNHLLVNAFASNNQKVIDFYEKVFKKYLKNEEILKTFIVPKDFYVNNLFWRILEMKNESCTKFLIFLLSLKSENDENFKKFFIQRDDKKFNLLSCLKNKFENVSTDGEKRIFEEKFQIFKIYAQVAFTDAEVDDLCDGPKDVGNYIDYIWTRYINHRNIS